MTHIICRASNCLFGEQGICVSEEIEYEPDAGCLTFQDISDMDLEDEEDEEFDWDDDLDDDDFFDDDDDWDEDDWDDEF